jgi:cobaltochelatase CobS
MAYPSHIARGALRLALRTHPDRDRVLNGIRVNDLTLDNLRHALVTLGVDPDETIRVAMGIAQTRGHITAPDPVQPEDATPEDQTEDQTVTDAIESEVQAVRSLIVTGGFTALDERLRQLVIDARKPAERVEVRIEVPIDVVPGARPVHIAKLTGATETWRRLFDVRGDMGKRTTSLWDGTHPDTPRVNDRYLWPHPQTETALSQIARGRNVMLYGPAGTGKTEFAQQLAARTGRPFALISCDTGTDASTLVGMTVPDASGGVTWQDGQLTRAIQTPGCVVCLDEPSVARPGALFVMQNVLANRQLFIAETGRRVCVAAGVLFLTTDNTNGMGGGSRKGYTDTNRLNAAFLDRFGVRVRVDYLPTDQEADVICGYTGCPLELARLLVSAATVTRAAADNAQLSHGIGLRRLLSWAELLLDGIDAEVAFQAAVLNCAAEQDVETLREQCLLAYDRTAVANALSPLAPVAPDPAIANPTPAGRSAAADFTSV